MDPSTVIDEAYGRYRELESDNALYRDKISRICTLARELLKPMNEQDRIDTIHLILFQGEMWNTPSTKTDYNSSNDPDSCG